MAESVLDLESFGLVLLFAKKSKVGVLPTRSGSEGLKGPERLDMSSAWAGVAFKPPVAVAAVY